MGQVQRAKGIVEAAGEGSRGALDVETEAVVPYVKSRGERDPVFAVIVAMAVRIFLRRA